jgi:hypothetical protein
MTTLYRRFRSLDQPDRRLVLRAAALMALVWTGLRLLRFATLRRILDRYAGSPAARNVRYGDPIAIDRVRWAIAAVAARFPSATCLVQALTGEVMLRRRGLDCVLRLGVRATRGSAASIEAHAWVECQGAVAIGAVDNLSTFQPLTAPRSENSDDSPTATDLFAGLLRGGAIPWNAFRMTPEEFLQACGERHLTCLVDERLRRRLPEHADWPQEIVDTLAAAAREGTATELLREQELISVLDQLASEDIRPILLKGAALAYSLYDSPASRPRFDTDLLIRRNQVDAVRRVMAGSGYTAPIHCEGELLFCQFPLRKTDAFGVLHAVDVHWKISTQSVFADVLGFDEIAAVAIDLPSLGVSARAAGPLHALLLACIHPVMHHRNVESLIWIYDIHLLAARLSDREFDCFAELAAAKQMSAICAYQLSAARRWFGTRLPDSVMMKLATVHRSEPSAAYLRPDRRWSHDLISSIHGLPSWSERLRLLREVTLPGPTYMLKAYGVAPLSLRAAFLPILYVHRLASGGWRVLSGQK